MTIKCDVLVIGAGPSGSSAARSAALGGAKTIFIDKKKEVGVPVQCAEGIGKYLLPYLPFKIPKKLLKWPIKGMSFWAEDITVERKGGMWEGYSINREEFDKWLADKAVKAGAELFLESKLIDLEVEDDYTVKKAIVKTNHGIKQIKPNVVIAADGVESTVLRLLGFDINLDENAGYVLGFEMNNVNLKNINQSQIFFGSFAPGGYAYIFPKSKIEANVGVAALFKKNKIQDYFEEFLEIPIIYEQLKKSRIKTLKAGWAPIKNYTKKWQYGNLLLAGDSGNQNLKPLMEGILPSIICGDIAGELAFKYLLKESALNEYNNILKHKLYFSEYNKVIKYIYELNNYHESKKNHLIYLGLFTNLIDMNELIYMKNFDYEYIKNRILNLKRELND